MSYPSYFYPRTNRMSNLGLALGSGVIFAVAVTNCTVYAGSVTSSQNKSSSGSGSGASSGNNGGTSFDPTCATIMLVVNIILAIFSCLFMLMFFWYALTTVPMAGWIPNYQLAPGMNHAPSQGAPAIYMQPGTAE